VATASLLGGKGDKPIPGACSLSLPLETMSLVMVELVSVLSIDDLSSLSSFALPAQKAVTNFGVFHCFKHS
jgi:hypothetical protein